MTTIPNVAEIEERQRRMGLMLQRLGTLPQDEAQRLDVALGAQQTIENASASANPITGDNTAIRSALNSREEVIRTNLTSILGYAPTRSDINDLLSLRNTMGSGFSGTISSLGRLVNTVEGGVAAVLSAIDNGISTAINTIINQAETAVNEAVAGINSEINNALNDVQNQAENLIPQELRDTIQDISNIPSTINDLVSIATDSVNRTIDDINRELNEISTSLQNEVREFIDSNINKPIRDVFNNSISSSITQETLPPIPRNEAGEPYAVGGGTLQSGDITSPIVTQ